jgi:TBC1 domain family member 20
MPYFALSWILTLFSHNIDTLVPAQRVFDFLLARNPCGVIYLGVAVSTH